MATVTGLTAARMLEIEAASVVSGEIDGDGHLILTTHGGDTIDAGGALVAVPDATTSLPGVVELATSAETAAATVTDRAVTPGSLAVVFSGFDSRLDALESADTAQDTILTDHESRIDALEAVAPEAIGITGEIRLWAGGSAPAGWQICFGQALSRTTYSALFAVIGTTYGAGDGSTTFNAPDFSGRVPVGVDFSQGEFEPMGKTGGTKTHTLTTSEIPSHQHAATSGGFTLGGTTGAYAIQGGATYGFGFNNNTADAGGGGAHNNLQPYLVLRFIIKL